MRNQEQRIGVYQRPVPGRRKWDDQKRRSEQGHAKPVLQTYAPPVPFVPAAAELAKAGKELFGIEGSTHSEPKKDTLVHDCFSQRHGYTKPLHCSCDTRIEPWKARNLVGDGLADFLIYKRSGRELENRKSIVVTEEFCAKRAQAFDALNHQLPLSISEFTDYHMAPISSEASCGDARIDKVRFATIHQRKSEVRNRRDHRVGTANFHRGDGGMTVGTNTKDKYGNYKVVSAGKWKSGNAPDSDSSREDLLDGNGVGQVNSKKDREFGRGLDSVLNMNAGPKPAKGSPAQKIEAARNLPKLIDERIGRKETAEFSKSLLRASIKTGLED